MTRTTRIITVIAALGGCSPAQPRAEAEKAPAAPLHAVSTPVTFAAADRVTLFARLYTAAHPKALILLFHQAGSSKDEYATIAPRLVAAGYSALAVDQRSGGTLFGVNQTAKRFGAGATYLDAKQDIQAAIDWATPQKLPIILWGSSYSSSLIFPVAADNARVVTAVLAFSPGEYFDDETLVARAAARVTVPVFVTVASGGEEAAAARPIVDAVRSAKTFYVPANGVHGSSTLIEARDPKGAAANWRAVTAFLARAVS